MPPVGAVKRVGFTFVVAAAAEMAVSAFPLSSAPRPSDRAQLAKLAVPIDFAGADARPASTS